MSKEELRQYSAKLMADNITLMEDNKILMNRINKAIEFIEEHNIIGTNKEYLPSGIEKCYSLELMEILKGEDTK